VPDTSIQADSSPFTIIGTEAELIEALAQLCCQGRTPPDAGRRQNAQTVSPLTSATEPKEFLCPRP